METKLNRRDFINRAALASASAGLGLGVASGQSAAHAIEPIRRVGGSRLKLSLNFYSFNQALNNPMKGPGQGMGLHEVLDFCAEHNFDAVDPTGYYFTGYPKVPSDQLLSGFKQRAHALGLDVSGTGVRTNFASQDQAKRAADLQHTKEWIEVAAQLGAPVLRVFAGAEPQGVSWDETAKSVAESLRECAHYGSRYGVLIGVQNHGDMLKTADHILKLLEMVNSPWLGVVVDTGNFPKDDPYTHIERVAPYAVNWQIKEKTDGKDGSNKLDLVKLAGILRKTGYRGYLPIETLTPTGATYDPLVEVPRFLKEVRAGLQIPT